MDTLVYIYRDRSNRRAPTGQDYRLEKLKMEDGCIIYLGFGRSYWNGEMQNSIELTFLQTAVRFLADEIGDVYAVYDDAGWQDYEGESSLQRALGSRWRLPTYRGFGEYEWLERVMEAACGDDYLVLGFRPAVKRLLQSIARRTRKVDWIVMHAEYREWQNEIEQCMDYFELEEGLVIALQVLTKEKTFRGMSPGVSREINPGPGTENIKPVTVLDFTGEERMSAGKLPRGSVWLDFKPSAQKRQRIEKCGERVKYFSAIKWIQMRKNSVKP